MNILETKQLVFQYKKQQVLNGLDLSIPQGCIYGFLGRNGAGKTTTIKLLLGLLDIPANTIYYYRDKELKSNRIEILKKIGSLVETPCYYEHLTGFENLEYQDFIYKKGKKRINHILKSVELEDAKYKKVKEYSTGMKQRLGFAMAIFHDPDILILDEPLNGLDPKGIHEMRELMVNLKNEGKTIFFSSHILSEVEKISTHIGILEKGRLMIQEDIQNLLSQGDNLESMFLNLISE